MRPTLLALLVASLALGGCGASSEPVIDPGDGGNYVVKLDPADFVRTIDNPWLPLRRGSRWLYEGRYPEKVERIEVAVTNNTYEIMGIEATVVRVTETVNGELKEDTFDWYAQDRDGNVWYLGEDSRTLKNGDLVSTPESWEAGVDGALPGIVMLGHPEVGEAYRQEFYPGEAEDMAEVIDRGVSERVPFRSLDGLLVTQEWTPLEPNAVEHKYYKAGVGLVLEETVRGGSDRIELISYEPAEKGRRV
jgi:hypothetical protein